MMNKNKCVLCRNPLTPSDLKKSGASRHFCSKCSASILETAQEICEEESQETDPGQRAEHPCTDWSRTCFACGASPVVPVTGMCGPCTFGEAEESMVPRCLT